MDGPVMSAGPDAGDVAELTRLLGLMRDFPSDEQRARYLLTSNWLRERGAEAARINAEQLAAIETADTTDGSGAYAMTDEERAAARRELARMPDDLRRRVHDISRRRGVDTVDGLAWYIREERKAER
jgi:hypothetical protein